MAQAFVLITSSALLGLIVLNPTLTVALLKTIRDTLTNGFAVARGGKA